MWKLYYKESWVPKNWWFWTVVLEKTLESPLSCKEIQQGNPKGNQYRIFIGKTDDEAETPILWPPDEKNWLIREDPDLGKDWRQDEKGMTGWDIWIMLPAWWTLVWANSGSYWWTGKPGILHQFGHKESETTDGLNWTELNLTKKKKNKKKNISQMGQFLLSTYWTLAEDHTYLKGKKNPCTTG